jgi:hypothetical protein
MMVCAKHGSEGMKFDHASQLPVCETCDIERIAGERVRCADIANLYVSQARPSGDESVGDCPLTAYFDGQRLVAQNIEHDIRNGRD